MSKYVNPLAVTEDVAELEIFVDGDKRKGSTGLVLLVRPNSHPEIKKFESKIKKEFRNASSSEDKDSATNFFVDNLDQVEEGRVRAHIDGWRWQEGVDEELAGITFSGAQLNEFLKAVPFGRWIKMQVLEMKDRDENFYKGLAKD